MVKKVFVLMFLILSVLIPICAKDPNLDHLEKIIYNPSIEESIKILEEEKHKGNLEPYDYVFLHYLLKAQGEREKSIYTALEGLENSKDEAISIILTDILISEFTYNSFTEKIATQLFGKINEESNEPFLKLATANALFIEYARKGDPLSIEKVLDNSGVPKGFFYAVLTDENPRLKFLSTDLNDIKRPEMKYCQRDGFVLHIPTTLLDTNSDFLALKSVPFYLSEDEDINLVIITNSPIKVYIDGNLAYFKNSLEENLPPKKELTFKGKQGNHIIDIIYYSVNNGDGITLSLKEADYKGKIIFNDKIILADKEKKISEFSVKELTPLMNSENFNDLIFALFKSTMGDLSFSRIAFEKIMESYPDSALIKILLLNLIIERSYDLPQTYAISKSEKIVESLLENNPNCPEILFYNILLKSSSTEKEEILSELRNLVEENPSDPRWFIQLSQELQAVNFIPEAKEVLLKAEETFPDNSFIEDAVYDFYFNLKDFENSLHYLDKISKRRVVYSAYKQLYLKNGFEQKALEYLIKESEILGDFDFTFEREKVDILLKMGRYEEAMKIVQSLLNIKENSQVFKSLKGRILFQMGKSEEAFSLFAEIKKEQPKYFSYDYAMWLLGKGLPFQNDRISYEEAVNNYDGKADGASSSYILDHQVTLIQKDGSTIERYHGIVKIFDKDGVEKEGEMQFPADYLVQLRTIKQDGRIVEPELVSPKRTIGMSGLEVGDIIEYEYFNLSDPNNIKKGSYYTPYVFLFQNVEKPFFHTIWTVKYPKEFKMDFYEQNLPEKPLMYEEDGLSVRKYDFKALPRIAFEPSSPFKNYYLPLVDIVGNFSWNDYFEYIKNQFVGSYPYGLEIQEKAKEITSVVSEDEEKVDAFLNFVIDEIEGDGERLSDPTETLLTGQGNRLQLLLAFLKCSKIDFEILLAQNNIERYDNNFLPSQGKFTIPLIKINLKKPLYLYLEDAYRNPKILPIYLQGSKYISLKGDRFVEQNLPSDYSLYTNCMQKEKRVIDSEGNLSVYLTQVLDPDQSSSLRSILKRLEKDRWKEVLQIAFSRQFGNAEIGTFDFSNIEDREKNLEIKAEIFVTSFGSRTDNKLKIDKVYERVELSKILATLIERELPLSISNPIILNQEFNVILPTGKTSLIEKKKKKLESKFGKYYLEVKTKKGEIFIKRFLYIYEQQVSKDEYQQFASFLREIDNFETTNIEIELTN